MLGSFTYCNPTRLYFGQDSLRYLEEALDDFGPNVLLLYGGGSIRENGIYDDVTEILELAGKNVREFPGILPNPTLSRLEEGIQAAREHEADLLLAVGGGSVIDFAKAVAVSANLDGDPWRTYFIEGREPECEVIPVGCVLTMSGTGSEMNAGSVITNEQTHQKIVKFFKDERVFPKFTILDPAYTLSLPHYQMCAGIFDIFCHICEQYFSGEDDCTSDYLSEGLMRSVIHSGRIACHDPKNYEARSNLMWSATWALNTLLSRGKSEDWMVHMLGQSVGGMTNATHGMTLSAVILPYYRRLMPYGISRFVRFARNVWDVDSYGKTNAQIAQEGLDTMETWMRRLGLVLNIRDLGVTDAMLEKLADNTIIMQGGYKVLDRDEILGIFRESMMER